MYSNPSFDPNLLSGHNQAQVQANYKALTAAARRGARPRRLPAALLPGLHVQDHHRRRRSTTTSRLWRPRCTRPWRPCRCRRRPTSCTTSGARRAEASCRSCSRCRATPASARSGWTWAARPCTRKPMSVRVQPDATHRPALRRPSPTFPPPPASSTTSPAWPSRPSASRTSQATPLQMAMVAGAVADGGTIMTPARPGPRHQLPEPGRQHLPAEALAAGHLARPPPAQVTQLMLSVVNTPDGTGTAARIPGVAGRRQDRHRPDRDRQDRRLVRGLRPGRQPNHRRGGAAAQPAAGQRVTRAAPWPPPSPKP